MTTQTSLSVTRWTRYGKDRLYVTAADGRRVGWLDLHTGQTTVELPELEDQLRAALAAHQGELTPAPAPAVRPEPGPAWVDLAANRPGQGIRALAEAEHAQMRERSRVGAFLARTFDVKTDERAWRVGADGEETVGARLEKLIQHGWRVLHSVPVGERGSDIDHVLIGPGGVYTVNTKNHPGKSVWVGRHAIKVDGHTVPYLRNSRHEAQRAERLLTAAVGWPVLVRPVLVLLTGTLVPNVTVRQQPDDVTVLDRMDVPRAFRRAPGRWTADQVAAVYEYARRSTTWTTTTVP